MADDPRPALSQPLSFPTQGCELRRLRMDRWRLVYAIWESDKVVDVLVVRKRPPYDYGDLETLLQDLA